MIYAKYFQFCESEMTYNPKVLVLFETKGIPMEQCKVKITSSMFSISGSSKV